ncbi:uncharacterized protein LOC144336013 [Macaca mulatta]
MYRHRLLSDIVMCRRHQPLEPPYSSLFNSPSTPESHCPHLRHSCQISGPLLPGDHSAATFSSRGPWVGPTRATQRQPPEAFTSGKSSEHILRVPPQGREVLSAASPGRSSQPLVLAAQ